MPRREGLPRVLSPVQKGEMLQKLFSVEEMLPRLLREDGIWRTLDVDYAPPRVERVWARVNDMRVHLHRIHPCDLPLFHDHPWPAAIKIVTGSYETALGFSPGGDPPPEAVTLFLNAGSVYEMVHPDAWHYVAPIGTPSLSLMVTGRPWDRSGPVPDKKLGPLPDGARAEILGAFRHFYPVP